MRLVLDVFSWMRIRWANAFCGLLILNVVVSHLVYYMLDEKLLVADQVDQLALAADLGGAFSGAWNTKSIFLALTARAAMTVTRDRGLVSWLALLPFMGMVVIYGRRFSLDVLGQREVSLLFPALVLVFPPVFMAARNFNVWFTLVPFTIMAIYHLLAGEPWRRWQGALWFSIAVVLLAGTYPPSLAALAFPVGATILAERAILLRWLRRGPFAPAFTRLAGVCLVFGVGGIVAHHHLFSYMPRYLPHRVLGLARSDVEPPDITRFLGNHGLRPEIPIWVYPLAGVVGVLLALGVRNRSVKLKTKAVIWMWWGGGALIFIVARALGLPVRAEYHLLGAVVAICPICLLGASSVTVGRSAIVARTVPVFALLTLFVVPHYFTDFYRIEYPSQIGVAWFGHDRIVRYQIEDRVWLEELVEGSQFLDDRTVGEDGETGRALTMLLLEARIFENMERLYELREPMSETPIDRMEKDEFVIVMSLEGTEPLLDIQDGNLVPSDLETVERPSLVRRLRFNETAIVVWIAPIDWTAHECPKGMVFVEGGRFSLGEGRREAMHDEEPTAVIFKTDLAIEPFCIDRFPFPGRAGDHWPIDGLNTGMVREFERQVQQRGRRLCLISELLLAAAGPENWRYPYHPEEWKIGVCDSDDRHPRPIGTFEGCVSPLGVRDVGIRSCWGRLGSELRDHLRSYGGPTRPPHLGGQMPGGLAYAVHGGTSRLNTYYAPNNFGVHAHEMGEPNYLDDTIRVCRDVGGIDPIEELSYREWIGAWGPGSGYAQLLRMEQ